MDMTVLLTALLKRMSEIAEDHDELEDSEVAENMTSAVHDGFFRPVEEFTLPDSYGMYSEEGNQAVKQALDEFISAAKPLADEKQMNFHERLEAFQNVDVTVGDAEFGYNDYFRYTPPEAYDETGTPLPEA